MFAKWVPEDQRYHFSPTDNGGVMLTDAEVSALVAGNRAGKFIVPDAFGRPTLSDPTIEQIRAAMQCAAWQLRRALTQMGLRDAVEAAIAAADQDTKDMWEYAIVYQRKHPIVAALAAFLNKTDADIDAVFALALTYTE